MLSTVSTSVASGISYVLSFPVAVYSGLVASVGTGGAILVCVLALGGLYFLGKKTYNGLRSFFNGRKKAIVMQEAVVRVPYPSVQDVATPAATA